jgi:hypothetical protein
MKKKFLKPTMDIVKIETPQVMAGSPGLGGNYTPDSDHPILGREFDDFEDELNQLMNP